MKFDDFRITMFSRRHAQPGKGIGMPRREWLEWLIVEREGSILKISDSPATTAIGIEQPPAGLSEENTIIGTLVDDDYTGSAYFRLVRDVPDSVSVAGSFCPADGFARLEPADNHVSLTVSGPYLHYVDFNSLLVEPADIKVPLMARAQGPNWTIKALHMGWNGKPAVNEAAPRSCTA